MSNSQQLYLLIVGIYSVLFALFCRQFYYRYYANRTYWSREPHFTLKQITNLAKLKKRSLPFFSIMIPARNEAKVIEKTLQHMSDLNYPKDKYQIIVVTDEKEIKQNIINQQIMVEKIKAILCTKHGKTLLTPDEQKMLIGIAGYVLLTQQSSNQNTKIEEFLPEKIDGNDFRRQLELVSSIAEMILKGNRHIDIRLIYRLFYRLYPKLQPEDIKEIYPQYLALSLPLIKVAVNVSGSFFARNSWESLIKRVCKTKNWFTREVITELTQVICTQLETDLNNTIAKGEISDIIETVYQYLFPTTQQVIARWEKQRKQHQLPQLIHKVVPANFDGHYGGRCLHYEVKSTKGRALNYALPDLPLKTALCGFYDAESRPDKNILLHVAYRCLKDGSDNRILQGPIFQVRNFYNMGPVSKIASLYQSVSHNWALAVTFKRIPFVGGTNVFMSANLLHKLQGYDHDVLTEDLEIGVRAYLEANVWPEYLPCPTSEQTPPIIRAFYKQRLRWGTGYLQVMDKLAQAEDSPQKMQLQHSLFWKGPIEWLFYQAASFIPLIVWVLFLLNLIEPDQVILPLRLILVFMSSVYITFTYYCFWKYYQYIDKTGAPIHWHKKIATFCQLLILPLAAFVFPIPFSSAIVLKKLNMHPKSWVKTPRTQE